MASSPEPAGGEGRLPDDGVRWPLVAKLGLAIAVVTVAVAVVAAVIAAFVIDRGEDARSARGGAAIVLEPDPVLVGIQRA